MPHRGWTQVAQAQTRKILVVASNQDVPNFDPHIATGYSASAFLRNVYDSLVRVEGNPVKIVPSLAASWTTSPDGMEYTFKLDPAAKFNDGTPVTSADVKYSFDRLQRLGKGNAWMVAGILDANSVQPVDPQTVKIKLAKPFVAFPQVLPWLWIVNAKEVEANKGADDGQTYLRTKIAGSGAFTIKRAEPGNLYEFEKVANPWKTGGGNLTGAIWRIIRETSNQRLAAAARRSAFRRRRHRRGHGRAEGQARRRLDRGARVPHLLDQDEHRVRPACRHQPAQGHLLRLRLQVDGGVCRLPAAHGRPAPERHLRA